MSKAYWIGVGIVLLVFVVVISLIFFSFLGAAVGMTKNLQENMTETLRQYGALNTTLGWDAFKFISQGFSILYSLYGLLILVFIIVLAVFIAEVIIWYAARRW